MFLAQAAPRVRRSFRAGWICAEGFTLFLGSRDGVAGFGEGVRRLQASVLKAQECECADLCCGVGKGTPRAVL